MALKAKFDEDTQTLQLVYKGQPIELDMSDIDAIFACFSAAGSAPQMTEPGGVHYPTGINAVPHDEALTLYMQFPDGSEGQFVFPAPGKSQAQVASASEALKAGFGLLFAAH